MFKIPTLTTSNASSFGITAADASSPWNGSSGPNLGLDIFCADGRCGVNLPSTAPLTEIAFLQHPEFLAVVLDSAETLTQAAAQAETPLPKDKAVTLIDLLAELFAAIAMADDKVRTL